MAARARIRRLISLVPVVGLVLTAYAARHHHQSGPSAAYPTGVSATGESGPELDAFSVEDYVPETPPPAP